VRSPILSRRRFLGLGLVLAVGIVVGCSSDDNTAVTDDPAPAEQQVLRLRLNAEPKTIDPHLTVSVNEASLTRPLFAGLFTYNEDLQIVPNAAAALPTESNGGISHDGLTYTVKIDRDAEWSDGRPLTAGDFVYSLKRALDPNLAGPYVSFFHGIVGARDYSTAFGTPDARKNPTQAELAALRDRVGVSAKDDWTVVYQLTQPNPSFLNQLALFTAYPVRQDVVERHGANWTEPGNLIGNGPFVLDEWAHNQRIVYAPNPNWHGEKARLQQLVVNFIADDAAAYAAYLSGEIDSVVVPAASRREVTSPGSPLSSQVLRVPELSTFALFMNGAAAPFDNVKVRQAFGMAIDRTGLVDGVLQGGARSTTSWIPPGMPGYDPGAGEQYEFNPARAKQLLAEAGYPDGNGLPKVQFMQVSNDQNRVQGQYIEDQLKRNLGIEVSTDYVESRVSTSRITGTQYQVTVQRWAADWPYPDNWLPELFGSTGSNNFFNYRNPRFDDIVRRAAQETDAEDSLSLYDEAHELMLSDAVVAPLYNRDVFLLVKPKVRGLVSTGIDGGIKGDLFFHRTYIVAAAE
jgi:oligopeptide transport system substrate-binding protein